MMVDACMNAASRRDFLSESRMWEICMSGSMSEV
jgi:hypothetical protein